MIPIAMGPMIPARMTLLETYSASQRKVKNEMMIRISTTVDPLVVSLGAS